MTRPARAPALLSTVALLLPGLLAAQQLPDADDSWTVHAIADIGMRVGTRDLGTNGGDTPVTTRLAVRSGIEAVPVLGVGMELRHPRSTVGVRAIARTTLGGVHRGRPGACALIEGAVCQSHEAGARVSSFAVEALFGSRREADARLSLSMGVGVRHYDFGPMECAADETLCRLVRQIQSDQVQPLFTFGLSLEGEVEGVPVHVKVQDFVGSFRADSAPAEGQFQNDLVVTLGVGFPLR